MKAKKTAAKDEGKKKRRSIRFKPEESTTAQIDLRPIERSTSFEPTVTGLVVEESYRGCGLVLLMTKELQVGAMCRLQVGLAPPLAAEVKWRTELDAQIMRIGLMYIE